MKPRRRVELALRGDSVDRVPFTMYENKIPQCSRERELRNRGLCIVDRSVPVCRKHHPNVKVTKEYYTKEGKALVRTHYETPAGTVTTLEEPAGFTTWWHERIFKTPDDYKIIKFMVEDQVFEPCYDSFAYAQKLLGDDVILRSGFGLEPLQTMISGVFMAMETFCVEWMDHRDEILSIYRSIVDQHRKIYPIIAESPALHANYGGNVVPEVIGAETFETYYVPHYNEAAEVMHKHGKLIGSHFDANCGPLKDAIAGTDLDYIEAFTPAPDTDMTLGEAREAWPEKVLWLNFPSSVHLQPDETVEQTTVDLLNQVDDPRGIIMGITEDIPENRWQDSCGAVMDGLDRHAKEKPDLYATLP